MSIRAPDHAFARTMGDHFNKPAAIMAHSRSIALFRRVMGPNYDLVRPVGPALLPRVRHARCRRHHEDHGARALRQPHPDHDRRRRAAASCARFYQHHFVNGNPADTKLVPVSRTIGADRVVDEMLFCFTHDLEIDWMLPGVAPTGKYVEVPLVAIVCFRGNKLYHEHIYWDQATVLVQIGALEANGLPVAGSRRQRSCSTSRCLESPDEEVGGQHLKVEGERTMDIKGSVALVTGSNRGIGRCFVEALLAREAAKVYASARRPERLADLVERHKGRVVPLKLDITVPADIAAAASQCGNVNLLLNDAGINLQAGLVMAKDLAAARAEMGTNFFGPLAMCRAFAPILASNGGGAIVNMLSILARVNLPMYGSLSASKAAALSLTQGVRAELAKQGTLVVAVMPGAVDTEMERNFPPPTFHRLRRRALPSTVSSRNRGSLSW